MNIKDLTKAQLEAVKVAVETGNAWNKYGSRWTSGASRMLGRLYADGWLNRDGNPTAETLALFGKSEVEAPKGWAEVEAADEELYTAIIPGNEGRVTEGKKLDMSRFHGGPVGKEHFPLLNEALTEGALKDLVVYGVAFQDNGQRVPPQSVTMDFGPGPDATVVMTGMRLDGEPATTLQGLIGRTVMVDLKTVPTNGGMYEQSSKRLARRCYPRKHRARVFKESNLNISVFKVLRTNHIHCQYDGEALERQDAYVCAIEAELLQFLDCKKSKHNQRKVNKLQRILRTLKKGLYQ